MVDDFERTASPFDWIVRIRSDLVFAEDAVGIPISYFDPAYAHVPLHPTGEIADHFAMLPRHLASTYSRTMEFNAGFCFDDDQFVGYACKTDGCLCMLTRHLFNQNVPLRFVPRSWYRYNKGV